MPYVKNSSEYIMENFCRGIYHMALRNYMESLNIFLYGDDKIPSEYTNNGEIRILGEYFNTDRPKREYATCEFASTPKGDKFIVKLDSEHEFHFYPCQEPYRPDYKGVMTRISEKDVYYVVYAKSPSGTKKMEFNEKITLKGLEYDNAQFEAVSQKIREECQRWGIWERYVEYRKRFSEYVDACKKISKTIADRKREYVEVINRYKNGMFYMDVYFDDKLTGRIKRDVSGYGIKNTALPMPVGNVELTEAFRKTPICGKILDVLENGTHPSTEGMTNLDKAYKPVYTERKLPKDRYKLVTCYRSFTDSEECAHCGKHPIVDVMIIQNPKGEKFHVGNECVRHLVDIPEEEFEEQWNKPFATVSQFMAKVRNDKAKDKYQYWFCITDENGRELKLEYISLPMQMTDYNRLNPNKLGFEKVLKRDVSVREFEIGFAKKMLPREYAKSIVANFDVAKEVTGLLLDPDYPNGTRVAIAPEFFRRDSYEHFHFSLNGWNGVRQYVGSDVSVTNQDEHTVKKTVEQNGTRLEMYFVPKKE